MNYVSALQELLALKHSDALSPPLLQSITTSLTALPPNLIQQLLQILLTAQFARASHYDLFRALVTGCAGRLIADARFYGGGFRASRRSARFLDLLFASLERQRSLTAVNLASAAVMGLEVCKDQPSVKASFRVKYGRKAIDVWTRAHEDIEVTGWMAAQAFPALPLETFAGSDVSTLLDRLTRSLSLTLRDGTLFDGLQADLVTTDGGTTWNTTSESGIRLRQVTEHRLFRNLGRLSKVISNCIEAARTPAELHAVQEALASLQSLSRTVSSSFRHSGWEDAAGTSKAMGKNALPWSILKAYLFSMTLIHFSVIALINAVESASSPPSSTSTQMCMTAVTTFRQLHFITLKFGHQGFPTYQGLFLGLTDVLKRSDPATVQAFLEREREDMSGRPDESAYWLVMCEEVMPLLHGDLVEQLLEEAKRHLEEGSQKDLVEGSHAVLLSVMEHQPNVARGLIPWYHAWQLENPLQLNPAQLVLTYWSTIRQASKQDPALAWACLERLVERIRHEGDNSLRRLFLLLLPGQLSTVDLFIFEDLLSALDSLHSYLDAADSLLLAQMTSKELGGITDAGKRRKGAKHWLQMESLEE